ncbi:MAG: recombinase family protein [Syntrophobacteraceae bacterium]|nr:recombinase family protein [Syntrophobacteraceae bacterium]
MERAHVIDTDLGQSGASAADREGFKRLITEVSLGRAGIVLGLEVSRLARNCMDWHRLLQLSVLFRIPLFWTRTVCTIPTISTIAFFWD